MKLTSKTTIHLAATADRHTQTFIIQYFPKMNSPLAFSFPLLLLLLFFFLSSIPSVSTISPHAKKQPPNGMLPSEAETLFKIMDSMSSDQSWRVSYSNPCKPGSSWPGIECKQGNDGYLHVTRLDFGTRPNPTCKKTATFPYQIFSLSYLQSVFFFSCFTHTKTTLSVSADRLYNSSLQQLSLRSNPALVGPIPPQISSLKFLQILTLSQNRLNGTIPVQVGNLRNLVGLDLSYNSLTGSIPSTIGQLGMLQKLDLSSNSLTGSIPDSIDKLSLLAFMALSNNKLTGNFPKGLAKLQSLQYFLMDDNPMFIPLPVEFGILVKLQELRLANSGYSGSIPPSFSQLNNLSTLSLQNNRLTGEIPVVFGSLSHIYHLNLSRNFLDGVVPFNSSFLKRLGRNLDLSGNPGLCLNPAEAYSVKIGIGVSICGSNKNGSLIKPVKKSQAPRGLQKSFSLFPALGAFALHYMLFLV
ncbi:receptor like protein 29 [Citrus sinensis]|uniref:receptor like protein 29 n=1 Tax=Citrus sinensis TaxID=2711 RepID=UPI0022787ECC|nr:receptor like protein 29 [Citrus sinensis]